MDDIKPDDLIAAYFRDAMQHPLLSAEEERALVERLPDREARQRLYVCNLRLVVSVAARYAKGFDLLEAIQEGNEGLGRAIDKYDLAIADARGATKFSTYATWWIRHAVGRWIANDTRIIRLPVHMHDKAIALQRLEDEHLKTTGRIPTDKALAKELGLKPSQMDVVRKALVIIHPDSLDRIIQSQRHGAGVSVGRETTLMDTIAAESLMEEDTEHSDLREALEEAMEFLPARSVKMLKYRYGLIDGQVHSLEAVGRKFGLTRERVRQIEIASLRRLRHLQRSKKLKAHL